MSKSKVQRRVASQKTKDQGSPSEPKVVPWHPSVLTLLILLFLMLTTLVAFWQLGNAEFINLDDQEYITDNPQVRTGLTLRSGIWAFTATYASNWHPLTWLSHMLDYELYGLNPGGHHFSNLLFHIANTLLLFLVLKRMTGTLWGSSFIAALFALHPLHVESVAWVAERKDVLSTFFWMLTMWAYVRYVERPGLDRYLLVLLFFALGLSSKPMLVTLPLVLLLLDYWPLGRFQLGPSRGHRPLRPQKTMAFGNPRSVAFRLVWEKIPLFVLSALSSLLTFVAQKKGGAVGSLESYPLADRISNALVSYVNYIGKMIWPRHLAILYPYPDTFPMWQVAGAGLFLVGTSIFVIRAARGDPYLGVGWLWYLGTLVPVIGLVQVGSQSMADRYTYVPLIGLFILIAWGVSDILGGWHHRQVGLAISGSLLLSIFLIITKVQIQHWQNSITLYKHALEVTANNYLCHNNLGQALSEQGQLQGAIAHYTEALRIRPHYAFAHFNLGIALAQQGRTQEAIVHYAEAMRIRPDYADAHYNIGLALARQGNNEEAVIHFREALRIKPGNAEVCINLGNTLSEQGRIEEAIVQYNEALRIKPNLPEAHFYLALAHLLIGNRASALEEYKILKTINPNLADGLSRKIFK